MSTTGSVSQDALRAGFQTTCPKGVAKLLKVDDITVELCKDFEPRHEQNVQKIASWFNKKVDDMKDEWLRASYGRKSFGTGEFMKNFRLAIFRRKNQHLLDKMAATWDIKHEQTKSDFTDGVIRTPFELVVTVPSEFWNLDEFFWRHFKYSDIIHKIHEETINETTTVTWKWTGVIFTEAKRGIVKYESYNEYSKTYIPDEVVDVVKEAVGIGLENIAVAYPSNEDATVYKDPIIVGYVGKQMYILAWFGYDKNKPMSCNI